MDGRTNRTKKNMLWIFYPSWIYGLGICGQILLYIFYDIKLYVLIIEIEWKIK